MYKLISYARCNGNDNWGLHGLWIDYDNGSYPEYCTDEPCPEHWSQTLLDLYPYCWDSIQTACHEWTKHGTCFNMTIDEYFNATIAYYLTYLSIPPLTSNTLSWTVNLQNETASNELFY